MRGDEIYYEMMKKLGYPLEGMYDGDDFSEKKRDSLVKDDEGNDVEEYIGESAVFNYFDYFENVTSDIFMFLLSADMFDNISDTQNSLIKMMKDLGVVEEKEEGGVRIKTIPKAIFPVSVLSSYPDVEREIKNKVESAGKSLEDSIIFVTLSKPFSPVTDVSPLWMLHDFGHGVFERDLTGDQSFAAAEDLNQDIDFQRFVLTEIFSNYISYDENKPMTEFFTDVGRDISSSIDSISLIDKALKSEYAKEFGNVFDWENHFFGVVLSSDGEFLDLPEELRFSVPYRNKEGKIFKYEDVFYLSPDTDIAGIQERIKARCEAELAGLKGHIAFNLS
jgi:hypothetical protein